MTAGRGKSYQQLVGNLRRGGGALILNMKTKANMKAKVLSKSGLKNLLIQKVHHEDHSLQRGGSMLHRRAQSDSLQSRLPITQHFGKSRPRRPGHKLRETEYSNDPEDLRDSEVSGSAGELDSELPKEEEEGDDSPLCDPEEMDLLGEIFDTLSSRSSHDRGLLYGTRSLDLFGPDSHDYIIKRGTANPSQESLSLSISGSGSLHSWNLETTEELSDQIEDTEWHCLDTSLAEEEGAECPLVATDVDEHEARQKEDRGKEKEANGELNGKQEINNINNFEEIKVEEEESKEKQENMARFDESSVEEITEGLQDKRIEDSRKDDEIQSKLVALVQEEEEEKKDVQENETKEEAKEIQEGKNIVSKETNSKCINRNDPLSHSVEELQNEAAVPPSPSNNAANPKHSASHDENIDKTPKKEDGTRLTSPPPKVHSAVARFQAQQCSQQGFQRRTISKNSVEVPLRCREKVQTLYDVNTNKNIEAPEEEEERPLVKVSELKKRFEA
uniref:Uncharacterized protein n=2 Tax=Cyprinodon variegatus TaxID=28743 RepID=A0A3Q2G070_CYPVA